MGLTIRRTGASDYGRYMKVMIGGDPGAGKTLLSSQWPNAFYASAEGGLMSIAKKNIPYTNIREMSELLSLKVALDNDAETREELLGFPVETLVVDTIDEVQRIMIRERLADQRRDTLQLQDWGYIGEQMAAVVRGFRNLDMHVIFTCHLKEVTDSDSGRVSYKPQMQGQYADQIAAQVDLALLLKSYTTNGIVDSKPVKITHRILQTCPDNNHLWIKDRSGKLPAEFPVTFTDDFAKINELIFGDPPLPEGEVSEITVEVPTIAPPLEPAAAPSVPAARRPGRPPTPKPAPTQVTEQPGPETVSDNPTTEPSSVETGPVESPEPTVEPAPSTGVVMVSVLNPEGFELKGIKPKPKGHKTDIYCQKCGNEVETVEKSELSRIRFRKIFCGECFEAARR